MKDINKSLTCSKVIALFLGAILFVQSCKPRSESTYIISKEDSVIRSKHYSKSGVLLMFPNIITGTYNFIIDEDDQCYFYAYQNNKNNGLSNDAISLAKPTSLSLLPNNIFKIPLNHAKEFMDQNIFTESNKLRIKAIVVSSFKDTIHCDVVRYLKKLENDTTNHVTLYIRRSTSEERIVLDYKKQGKYYDPIKTGSKPCFP